VAHEGKSGAVASASDTPRSVAPDEARAALDGATLPAGSLNAALPHLRRPFAPEAIKFKVQSVWPKVSETKGPTGCIVVSYIDARLVVERLNAVCGSKWHAEYRGTSKDDLMLCDLTLFGVTRTDVGEAKGKGLSKDLISDALKRSAVMFGVGVSVYALAQISLRLDDPKTGGMIRVKGEGKYRTIVLKDEGHARLRAGYASWLEAKGVKAFGPALDHGDEGAHESTYEGDGAADETFVPEAPAALEDAKARELQERARALYADICDAAGGQQALPRAQFDGYLAGAWHSHDELERLVEHLEERLVGLQQQAAKEAAAA
jgi:hypothetical protein